MSSKSLTKVQRTTSHGDRARGHGRRPQSAGHPQVNLQRSIGNQAVYRLLRSLPIQTKLQITEPADELERPHQGIQSQIEGLRSGGQQLPESLRAYFEPRFGHDFSGVRLHTGSGAAEAAQNMNAKAFTVGRDIAFGTGEYSPETGAGKRLLAHELTHVVQQSGASPGWLRAAGRGLAIQRQSGTDYGLAGVGSRNKYVTAAVQLWKTQKGMSLEEFANTLMKAIETDLLSQGVPKVQWQISPGLGVSGSFDQRSWVVKIDPDAFSESEAVTKVGDLTLPEVQEIVGTLYHESRHLDQDVLIIRTLLDQKKAVKEIFQLTKIPESIINKVKATTFKTPLDKAQVAHAKLMFAVMYGEHSELLTFLVENSESVGKVQSLVSASSAKDLKDAEPHVDKLAEWAKNILAPKVKKLEAGKKGGRLEAQLKQDLAALNRLTAKLLNAFSAARKNPQASTLNDLQKRTQAWQVQLFAAYRKLEGEKDAFRVEELVKQAFQKEATAKPKPARKK